MPPVDQPPSPMATTLMASADTTPADFTCEDGVCRMTAEGVWVERGKPCFPREGNDEPPLLTTHTLDGDDIVPTLAPFMNKGQTTVVVAGCGAQKSYQSRLFMEKQFEPHDRIYALSCRVSHAHDAHRELKSLGFVVYTDKDLKGSDGLARLLREPRIIISLESLYRLKDAPPPSLLLIDEVRTVASAYGGQTITQPESLSTFERLYQGATYRLAMGADITLDGAVDELLKGLAGNVRIPIVKLIVPKPRLIRKLNVGFKRNLTPLVLHALKTHHGVAPIAIACGSLKQSTYYAEVLAKNGYSCHVYNSKTGDATKRDHFSDPDTFWSTTDAVIFTTSLSVGVDVRRCVFGKVFLETCPNGSPLRDLFQGLCRFGRKGVGCEAGQLIDDVIEVSINCIDPRKRQAGMDDVTSKKGKPKKPKYKPYSPVPKVESVLGDVEETFRRLVKHSLQCARADKETTQMTIQIINDAISRLKPYQWRVEAWNVVERHRNSDIFGRQMVLKEIKGSFAAHYLEFCKIAKHRGWSVKFVDDDDGDLPVPGEGSTLGEEQHIQRLDDVATYEYVRQFVESVPDGRTPDEFFVDCYGLSRNKSDDKTAKEKALLIVYYNLNHLGFFPDADDYMTMKRHKQHMRNHALLRCRTLATQMLGTIDDLLDDERRTQHPLLGKGPQSAVLDAGLQLTRVVQLDSMLFDGVALPQLFVDQIVAEKQAVRQGTKHPYGKAHSAEGKRRKALKEQLAALERSRGKDDTLSLLSKAAKHFNMRLIREFHDKGVKRNLDGDDVGRERRVLRGLTLECSSRHLQDEWMERCTHCKASIRLKHWDAHQAEHDAVDAEASYASFVEPLERADDPAYEAFLGAAACQPIVGVYEEPYDADVVEALCNCEPRNLGMLGSSYETVRRIPYYGHGIITIANTYRRHFGGTFGRKWATNSFSLQTCNSLLRPLIAGKFIHDIDIKNCHPNIVNDVAAREGVDLPILRQYCEDRKPLLAALARYYGCTRDNAKILILRMLNGGSAKVWREEFGVARRDDHDFVEAFKGEVRVIRDMMLNAYPRARELLDERNAHASEPKDEWSAMSWVLCELENAMISTLERKLKDRGWVVVALVFDGLNVRRREGVEFDDALLRELEVAVDDDDDVKRHGIKIRLEEKPMTPSPEAQQWLDNALAARGASA